MLSMYVWDLKRQNIGYDITWKVLSRAKAYSPASKICNLCNMEKFYIMFHPQGATLNKRNEAFNFCMHRPWTSLALQKVDWEHQKLAFLKKSKGSSKQGRVRIEFKEKNSSVPEKIIFKKYFILIICVWYYSLHLLSEDCTDNTWNSL